MPYALNWVFEFPPKAWGLNKIIVNAIETPTFKVKLTKSVITLNTVCVDCNLHSLADENHQGCSIFTWIVEIGYKIGNNYRMLSPRNSQSKH